MSNYNYVYTKSIPSGTASKTLRQIFQLAGLILLDDNQGNFIRKAVFCVKGGAILAASGAPNQNSSCFVSGGEDIKLADNSTALTNPPIYFEIDCGNLAGSPSAPLDLRTALRLTTSGTVDVVLFF